jgi:hypothetical protein
MNISTLLFASLGLALSCAALAQSTNYSTVNAVAGMPVQINFHASFKKDCTAAPLPTIRVIQPPKSGTLTVRRGVLNTNKVAGCPALKSPAQVVFYLARAGQGSSDHLVYEVTSSNGEVAVYDITIEIKEADKSIPPTKGQGI